MTWWLGLAIWSGWIACGLSAILALPQALALRRASSAVGVSLLPWQALLAANIAWAAYSTFTAQPSILVQTLVSLCITCVVITMICRTTRRATVIRIVIPAMIGGATLLTLPVPVVFGLLTSLPILAGWSMQLARIRKTGRPAGLSFGGMLLNVLCQCFWLVYAVIIADLALITSVIPVLLSVAAAAITYMLAPTDDQVRHGQSTFSTRRSYGRRSRPVRPHPAGRSKTGRPRSRDETAGTTPSETLIIPGDDT